MKYEKEKETSKWVLGGDGITNIQMPKENIEFIKKLNRQKQMVKQPKRKKNEKNEQN